MKYESLGAKKEDGYKHQDHTNQKMKRTIKNTSEPSSYDNVQYQTLSFFLKDRGNALEVCPEAEEFM